MQSVSSNGESSSVIAIANKFGFAIGNSDTADDDWARVNKNISAIVPSSKKPKARTFVHSIINCRYLTKYCRFCKYPQKPTA